MKKHLQLDNNIPARLTGHDLDIGTGGLTTTNYQHLH